MAEYCNNIFVKTKNTNFIKNNQLGSYLAGLIEGDGYILIRKGKGEKLSPAIIITFNIKEMPFFVKLKSILNYGNIYKEKNGVCRFKVTNARNIINLINLINGYFRTPKIEALHRAIDNLNMYRNAKINKLPLDNSNFSSNAWLAGFTDADGSFSIKLIGSYSDDSLKTHGRVMCVFSINQREIYKRTGESFTNIISKLAEFFQCNINHKLAKHPSFIKPVKLLVFYVQANTKHHLVINYFNKYPLMTSKYLNYLDYYRAIPFLGKRLTYEEVLRVREIKNSMNNKRTYFN
jgi:hypothetical protein